METATTHRKAPEGLMTVGDYAETYVTRRGFEGVDISYIYKLIKQNQQTGKVIPFDYKLIDRKIFIVKPEQTPS